MIDNNLPHWYNEKISTNFYMHEFLRSQTATRYNIQNIPNEEERENIHDLVKYLLQPLRTRVGSPLVISSGFRSTRLNLATGGSENSEHAFGGAADFECFSMSNYELARIIRDEFMFHTLILEFPKDGQPNAGWVHASFFRGSQRKRVLTALRNSSGVVKYHSGLIVP